MRFIISLIFVCLTAHVSAQFKLSGTVRDLVREPVPFAIITLKNSEGLQKKMQCDSLGTFFFDQLGKDRYLITVTHVNYQEFHLETEFKHDTTLLITLAGSKKLLEEVLVVGRKDALEKSSDRIVYNVANSVMATGSSLLEAIGQIPGIRINNDEINAVGRGLVKVMINRRLIQLSGEDLTRYLGSFSANDISRIEFIANPSAEYEVEGNSGLINIITKKNRAEGSNGDLQFVMQKVAPGRSAIYGFRNFGEVGISGNYAYNHNKWSAHANVNGALGNLLEGFETDIYYPNQQWLQTDTGTYKYNTYSVIAGVDYRLNSNTTIGISFLGGRNNYDGSDHVNNPIYDLQGRIDSTLKTYATYYPIALNNSINLFAEIKLDTSGKQLLLNVDYFNYYRTDVSDFEGNGYNDKGVYKPESSILYADNNKQNIVVYTIKADLELPTSFAKFSVGSKISFIDNYSNAFYYNKINGDLVYNTDLSNEFNYKENTQSFYGNMNKESGSWRWQTGLRVELTQTRGYSFTLLQTTVRNYFRLFPSILVNYAADSNNNYSLSFNRRINRPSFWNLNPYKSLYTAYSFGEGNPFLQPEYNNNFELSHAFKHTITSTLFGNITENGFNPVTLAEADTNLVFTMPLNFLTIYKVGVSENVSLKISNWWESNQLASFYHTTAHSKIASIRNSSGFGTYLASNNTFYFNSGKTLAGAVNFWYQFPEIDRIGRSDAYYKLDLGLKTSTLNNKLDIALNLFDAFRSSFPTVNTTINGIPQRFSRFQVNRFLQLSFSYKFGKNTNRQGNRSLGNEEERERI